MGPSGSGKTTFLNVAGLLDTFDAGTYELDGKDVSRLSDDEMSRFRNRKIGFVFQSFNLIPDLDVFDNVDVPLRYRGLPASERKARIDKALEQVGLSSRARHLPSQLSGGQQQRVAIARVLAGDPRLILADEPTGNLDSLMTREILDLLEEINGRGTTIVMVTHSPECATRAHRQIHLLDGKVVDLDAPPSLARASEAVPAAG
jgi:putative ABC transport system ATP-binding protein